MYDIINSMYNSVKSRVKTQGELSDEFDCLIGVRQGECLSPFLFSLFLNDLEQSLVDGNFTGLELYYFKLLSLLYADDVALFSDSRDGLQSGLDVLYDYCTRWKLTVNAEKTKVVVFRRGGRLAMDDHFFYGDTYIEVIQSCSFPGILFSSTGKFTQAQKDLADKAKRALFKLFKDTFELYDPEPDFMCSVFDKLIMPILMYCSEVWGFCTAPDIEKVHLYFCKRILRLKRSTASYFVYGELGRYPLYVYRLLRIIKYWLKLVMIKVNPLVHSMYLELYRQIHPVNLNNWASMVKKMLSELGFGHVWLQQGVGNLNGFMRMCKQRVFDQFVARWNSQLNESSDALLYREVKTVFEYSSYLRDILVPRYRYAL